MQIIYKCLFVYYVLVVFSNHLIRAQIHNYTLTYRDNTFEISHRLYILHDAEDIDYPGQCYHHDTEYPWSVGVHYQWLGECKSYYCSRPGFAIIRDCGKVKIPKTCSVSGLQNVKESLPFCCPKYLCKDSKGESFLYNPLAPSDF